MIAGVPAIHFGDAAGEQISDVPSNVAASPSAEAAARPSGRISAMSDSSTGMGDKDTIVTARFILSNQGKVQEVYILDEAKLGEGTFGSVAKATHRATKKVRAVKTVSKANMKNVAKFRREIEIMKLMDHPNIIKLFETFEDTRNIYLAMDYCSGGELFDRIIEAGTLTEREGAIVAQQILRAVNYMHDHQVAHRDLKPENFLFATKDAITNSLLKIIDFGLSCFFKPGQVLSTRAGTPYYVAPQVLQGKYDHMCDLWSVGVILYILLCGYPPFYGRTDHEVLSKVKKGKFVFEEKDWGRVSQDAKHFIRSLLQVDPKARFSAQKALGHKWIQQTAPRTSTAPIKANPNLVDNLRSFRSQNKLKKAALQIIATQLDDAAIRGLRDTFTALDSNGDGLLSCAEIKSGLEKAGVRKTASDLELICDGIDTDGSGVIDYTEFLAAALDKRSYLSEQACWTAFKVFDLDGDDKISAQEIRAVLEDEGVGEEVAAQRSAEVVRCIDKNGDGVIDFKEFWSMMGGKSLGGKTSPPGAKSGASGTGATEASNRRSPRGSRCGGA